MIISIFSEPITLNYANMLHMCYIMLQNNFKYIISSLNAYKILISVNREKISSELHKFLAKTDPMRVFIYYTRFTVYMYYVNSV